MNKILMILLCCLSSQFLFSQNISMVKDHLEKIGKGKSSNISRSDLSAFTETSDIVTLLNTYLDTSNEKVKREAIRLMVVVGSQNSSIYTRKSAVDYLVKQIDTEESSSNRQIVKGLRKFKAEDFDENIKKKVGTFVRAEYAPLEKWVELAGFLQLQPVLEEIKYKHQDNKQLRQKIGIALTRCGDKAKVENLLKNIRTLEVNDEFVYGVVPLLVYARQKETTDFLFDIILSDEKKCTPAGPDIEGNILCGYRVMEAIAPYVEGIPLEIGPSGDLVTNDYKKALSQTRQWINNNRSTYQLITDKY